MKYKLVPGHWYEDPPDCCGAHRDEWLAIGPRLEHFANALESTPFVGMYRANIHNVISLLEKTWGVEFREVEE